jgi:hypothetical protein
MLASMPRSSIDFMRATEHHILLRADAIPLSERSLRCSRCMSRHVRRHACASVVRHATLEENHRASSALMRSAEFRWCAFCAMTFASLIAAVRIG